MTTSRSHTVGLNGVSKQFGSHLAVDNVSLMVEAGELVALLGPSGCGKSTLLRIIAGFEAQSSGSVNVNGKSIDSLPPFRRGVGIVFQNYALFPHMTVEQNVAYGLQVTGRAKAEIGGVVADLLKRVQMTGYSRRLPTELSGGQQQRVAIARCLAVDPKVLLLDEPFGALDKNLRLDMQIEVKRLQREFGITTILVTHDQEEALSMADRIAVMNKGRIEQVADPHTIYDRPASLFVNQFVGHTNVIHGTLTAEGTGEMNIQFRRAPPVRCEGRTGFKAGTPVLATLRPERVRMSTLAFADSFQATITAAMPLGPNVVYEALLADGVTAIKSSQPRDAAAVSFRPGELVHLGATAPDAWRLFADQVMA